MKWLKRWNKCTVIDCGERVLARGMCSKHYRQQRRPSGSDQELQYSLNNLGIGVTVEWYRAQQAKQSNCCAMCGKPPKRRRLSVDHDHETNTPRELLCGHCNMVVGILESKTDMARGMEYIERHLAAKRAARAAVKESK